MNPIKEKTHHLTGGLKVSKMAVDNGFSGPLPNIEESTLEYSP